MEATKLDDSNIGGIVVSEDGEGITTSGQTPVLLFSPLGKLVGVSQSAGPDAFLPLCCRVLETNIMLLVLEAHN